MLGGRVDQPGGLELVDAAQALNERVIDQIPFGNLRAWEVSRQGGSKGNIPIDRILKKAFPLSDTTLQGLWRRGHFGMAAKTKIRSGTVPFFLL